MFYPHSTYAELLEAFKFFVERNVYKAKKFIEIVEKSNKILIVTQPLFKSAVEFLQYYFNSKGKIVLATYSENELNSITKNRNFLVIKVWSDKAAFGKNFDENKEPIFLGLFKDERELLKSVFPRMMSKEKSFLLQLLTFVTLGENVDPRIIIENLEKIANYSFRNGDLFRVIKKILSSYGRCFCLGKGFGYPIAIALCDFFKSCLGIHAESYPAGESKHGPIALIEEGFPVIQIVLEDNNKEKMLTSIMEMKARGAKIISILHKFDERFEERSDHLIVLPVKIEENKISLASLLYLAPFIC